MGTKRYLQGGMVLLLVVIAGGVGSAYADAVIYEGFNYGGNITGNNGGIGFDGPWQNTRNNPQAVDPGLTWGALPVDGNTARGAAWSGLIRPIGTTLSDAGLMTNGSTLWFSVIFDLTGQNTTNADLNLALGTDKFVSSSFGDRQNLDGNTAEGIGVSHHRAVVQGKYWQDDGDGDAVAEGVRNASSLTINSTAPNIPTALIVGKIDWGVDDTADETLTLYAPTVDLDPNDPIMEAWTIPALDQSLFDQLSLQFKDSPKMDEIRFGATYDDVIGVMGPGIVAGDTNGDGLVDAADYIALKENFPTASGATQAQGDVEDGTGSAGQDGDVDWADLNLMAGALNAGAAAVPEPATLGLLALGALAVVRRRKK